jgi:hypothetical protein
VRRARGYGYNVAIVDILKTIKLDGRVIDGVQLEAKHAHGHLACKALGEVIHEQMHIHGW